MPKEKCDVVDIMTPMATAVEEDVEGRACVEMEEKIIRGTTLEGGHVKTNLQAIGGGH